MKGWFNSILRLFTKKKRKEKWDADDPRRLYEEATGLKWSDLNTDDEHSHSDYDDYLFNDPYIETEAKNHRNDPNILTFIYEKKDSNGNTTRQERAIQPYYIDGEYLQGYCLDREGGRTFKIERIARFTGNSEELFYQLENIEE